MLCSFYVFEFFVAIYFNDGKILPQLTVVIMTMLALSKVILGKYLPKKFGAQKPINLNLFIREKLQNKDSETITLLKKITIFAIRKLYGVSIGRSDDTDETMGIDENEDRTIKESIEKMFFSPTYYERIKEEVEEMDLDVTEIDDIDIGKLSDLQTDTTLIFTKKV